MERKQADRPKPLLDLLLSGETMHPDQFKPDPQKIAFWGQVPMADSEAADCSEAAIEELRRTWAEEGVPYRPDQVIGFTFGKPRTRVMIHVTHMDGTSHDIGRFSGEYADKLEAARQAMHTLFCATTEEASMQSVIAQAADAKGVKREDLCLYLMCLGLMQKGR